MDVVLHVVVVGCQGVVQISCHTVSEIHILILNRAMLLLPILQRHFVDL